MTYAERIRKLRLDQDLTQAELAEKAGIAINTIRLYEGGKSKPRPKQLKYLANALGVSPEDILGTKASLSSDTESVDYAPKAISARVYPKGDGSAILTMTYQNGKMHILPDYSIPPDAEPEATTWHLSKEDADGMEALLRGYYDKTGEFLFSPEMGAGIKLMLDKMAQKRKHLLETDASKGTNTIDK